MDAQERLFRLGFDTAPIRRLGGFHDVPGKHRNKDAAWDALCETISTPGH